MKMRIGTMPYFRKCTGTNSLWTGTQGLLFPATLACPTSGFAARFKKSLARNGAKRYKRKPMFFGTSPKFVDI